MYAYNVKREALLASAKHVGVEVNATEDGNRIRFTLKLAPDKKFQKLNPQPHGLSFANGNIDAESWTWRKSGSVCFHGHYAFIDDLLDWHPDAIITSSRFGRVKYNSDNFESEANEYGDTPLGPPSNIYHGFHIRDTCECEKQ